MTRWWRRLWQKSPDPERRFRDGLSSHCQRLLDEAGQSGFPRGLQWISVVPRGEPHFVRDRQEREQVVLLPVTVQFEPAPGSEMEEVAAAREPRAAIAVFRWKATVWQPESRLLFNLSVQQVIERSGGRFEASVGKESDKQS